uniref:Uncharacterized protein n=1 Tax=Anopheles albimanus TaxID=7167 RepID=A0A182FXP4_ANOAL
QPASQPARAHPRPPCSATAGLCCTECELILCNATKRRPELTIYLLHHCLRGLRMTCSCLHRPDPPRIIWPHAPVRSVALFLFL